MSRWHWMSFDKKHYPGNLMEYLNSGKIEEFKVLFENSGYWFVMIKMESNH